LVVVVRDTDEATSETVERFIGEHGKDIPTVLAKVAKPGVVAATNAGLPHATGDVVCFIDDDAARLETGWRGLRRIIRAMKNWEGLAGEISFTKTPILSIQKRLVLAKFYGMASVSEITTNEPAAREMLSI